MTASQPVSVGYVRDQTRPALTAVGGFVRMCVLTGKALFTPPFQWREFILQSWFLFRVSFLPTLAVSIPLTVLLIFTLNILLAEFGAADVSGAGAALGAVTQLGPLVTVLVVAGAGSTAICADLGARTIREEIDALEVLGIDPIHRLVVPRVVASTFVAFLLNGAVITIGLVGGFIFGVYLQNVSAGAYVSTLTLITGLPEVLISVVKATDFGLIAGLVGCYRGLTVSRRRQGRRHRGQRDAGAVRDRAVRGQRGADHDRCPVRNGALTCRPLRSCVLGSRGAPPVPTDWSAHPARFLDSVGHVAWFVVTAIGSIGHALRYYRKETLRLIAEIGMGTGAMAVIGGTVAIVGFVTPVRFVAGRDPGLRVAGQHRCRGVHRLLRRADQRAHRRTRWSAGQALAATVGAGATAELGAMRISEEIDALEVMGIKSISYLVSTRIMAGFVVIIPLYAMAIIMSFLSGAGDHDAVLRPVDRHLRALLPHVPATRRRVLVVRAGDHHLGHRDAQPLLLRLLRQRRAGRRRRGRRPVDASLAGRDRALVVLFASLALYGVDPNFNLTV